MWRKHWRPEGADGALPSRRRRYRREAKADAGHFNTVSVSQRGQGGGCPTDVGRRCVPSGGVCAGVAAIARTQSPRQGVTRARQEVTEDRPWGARPCRGSLPRVGGEAFPDAGAPPRQAGSKHTSCPWVTGPGARGQSGCLQGTRLGLGFRSLPGSRAEASSGVVRLPEPGWRGPS